MMREKISEAYKTAMKAKDQKAVSTIRLIQAALKDRDIAARGKGVSDGIGDDEIQEMLLKMVRQRKDSIDLYEQGGRLELAQQEQAEIEVINAFLPKQMDESEISVAVDQVMKDMGATGLKDIGPCMAELKKRHAGSMDFSRASAMVKDKLG